MADEITLTGSAARIVSILRALHRGRENAVPHKKLAAYLGVHPRHLREIVERLRKGHGLPVMADYRAGYFWAESLEEVKGALEPMRRHGVSILATRAALLKTARRLFSGQLSLDLEE